LLPSGFLGVWAIGPERSMYKGTLIADLLEAVRRAEKASADASMESEIKEEVLVSAGPFSDLPFSDLHSCDLAVSDLAFSRFARKEKSKTK
jgi:hypothetical protein